MHNVPCLVKNSGKDASLRSRSTIPFHPFFAGLVVIAGEFHPIPFRTRPLKPPAPMVLRANTRESRSPPGQPRTDVKESRLTRNKRPRHPARPFCFSGSPARAKLSPSFRKGGENGKQGTAQQSREEKTEAGQRQEERRAAGFAVCAAGTRTIHKTRTTAGQEVARASDCRRRVQPNAR